MDIAPSVISSLWSQFKTSGIVRRRPGQGCPRATTANKDRYLFLSDKRHRTATATLLSRDCRSSRLLQEHQFPVRQFLGDSVKEGCVPGITLFASLSLPLTKKCVQNDADNISIGHSFNGLMLSSPMSPESVYNLILNGY